MGQNFKRLKGSLLEKNTQLILKNLLYRTENMLYKIYMLLRVWIGRGSAIHYSLKNLAHYSSH